VAAPPGIVDRVIGSVSPAWQLRRIRARHAADLLQRHYEAANVGRRTQGWAQAGTDANTANAGAALARVRNVARDLVRNNGYAESALTTIADHAIGWGISPRLGKASNAALDAWRKWAESTDCDADGRCDFYGLQKLIMRSIVESGEVLIRRRRRLASDGFALPMQLQVLEADFLDASRTAQLPNGGKIIQGVEFDPIGRRVAYWLFPKHPGAAIINTVQASLFPASARVDAAEILHIYKPNRPGQVRAITWFAPVLVRFKDFDEYEDAALMKAKIAACLAVVTSDVDGSNMPLGTADPSTEPEIDTLSPGAILNIAPGRTVEVVQPPNSGDYPEFSKVSLRAIATGLGVTYEDLTGDYQNLPFSAARMSRLRHWARVEDWRWRLIVPQLCAPVWKWAMQDAFLLTGVQGPDVIEWTAPPLPMLDPDKEGLAYMRNVRAGLQTLSEAIRERGGDPRTQLEEMAADNKLLDELGIVLDSDPRYMTQAGQAQPAPTTTASSAGAEAPAIAGSEVGA